MAAPTPEQLAAFLEAGLLGAYQAPAGRPQANEADAVAMGVPARFRAGGSGPRSPISSGLLVGGGSDEMTGGGSNDALVMHNNPSAFASPVYAQDPADAAAAAQGIGTDEMVAILTGGGGSQGSDQILGDATAVANAAAAQPSNTQGGVMYTGSDGITRNFKNEALRDAFVSTQEARAKRKADAQATVSLNSAANAAARKERLGITPAHYQQAAAVLAANQQGLPTTGQALLNPVGAQVAGQNANIAADISGRTKIGEGQVAVQNKLADAEVARVAGTLGLARDQFKSDDEFRKAVMTQQDAHFQANREDAQAQFAHYKAMGLSDQQIKKEMAKSTIWNDKQLTELQKQQHADDVALRTRQQEFDQKYREKQVAMEKRRVKIEEENAKADRDLKAIDGKIAEADQRLRANAQDHAAAMDKKRFEQEKAVYEDGKNRRKLEEDQLKATIDASKQEYTQKKAAFAQAQEDQALTRYKDMTPQEARDAMLLDMEKLPKDALKGAATKDLGSVPPHVRRYMDHVYQNDLFDTGSFSYDGQDSFAQFVAKDLAGRMGIKYTDAYKLAERYYSGKGGEGEASAEGATAEKPKSLTAEDVGPVLDDVLAPSPGSAPSAQPSASPGDSPETAAKKEEMKKLVREAFLNGISSIAPAGVGIVSPPIGGLGGLIGGGGAGPIGPILANGPMGPLGPAAAAQAAPAESSAILQLLAR